ADLTYDYILNAKYRNKYSLLTNSIAEELPFRSNIFDVVISSYLSKYVDTLLFASEIWRILKNKGLVIMHDFTYPDNKLLQTSWHFYFSLLKKLGKFLKSWEFIFSNLDAVIKNSKWTENLIADLKKKGFQSIDCKYYTLKTSAIILAQKP
ncbi:MAG: class I SAM-dependent methyltransferase, partial [Nitrososphaeraceae archaeon]